MFPFWINVSFAVEIPFLLLHVSMSVFIVHQIQKGTKVFLGAFYKIYVLQSFFDCCNYVQVAKQSAPCMWVVVEPCPPLPGMPGL